MKKHKVMSQIKKQDKTSEKQLNEVEIGNFPEKKIQNNDSEDDRWYAITFKVHH